jgi:hypothetical protein
MTEFAEGLWVCAVIFTALGLLVVILYCIGILYRGIRDWFENRNKGMIGRRVS